MKCVREEQIKVKTSWKNMCKLYEAIGSHKNYVVVKIRK